MHPPQRQSVARISEELGIHVMTLYKWRKAWRLQGEVVPSSEKEPEGWSAADKFTVVLESSGLNAPRFQESCHPFDPSIRGLEDMSNAALQRGRQG